MDMNDIPDDMHLADVVHFDLGAEVRKETKNYFAAAEKLVSARAIDAPVADGTSGRSLTPSLSAAPNNAEGTGPTITRPVQLHQEQVVPDPSAPNKEAERRMAMREFMQGVQLVLDQTEDKYGQYLLSEVLGWCWNQLEPGTDYSDEYRQWKAEAREELDRQFPRRER